MVYVGNYTNLLFTGYKTPAPAELTTGAGLFNGCGGGAT